MLRLLTVAALLAARATGQSTIDPYGTGALREDRLEQSCLRHST